MNKIFFVLFINISTFGYQTEITMDIVQRSSFIDTYESTLKHTPEVSKIKALETQAAEMELAASRLRSDAQYLKEVQTKNAVIKIREEVRRCLSFENENIYLKSSTAVSDCIAATNGIIVTRELRSKITSTLSLMYREGEIDKLDNGGVQAYYGLKKYFNKGKIKKEFEKKIKLVI